MGANNHFTLLLALRWRLFVNSLRRGNRRSEFGAQILAFVLGAIVVFGLSAAFFGGTLGLLNTGHADFLDLLLWAVFLIWQLAPILFEGYSPGLNFREVARYPISFRTYFLLNAAYGISDPAALACLLWLFSMWLGILIAKPDWAITALAAFLLFALFNLFCNRVIIGLFDRFQSTRKGRERMVVIMLAIMLLPQLMQLATANWASVKRVKVPGWVLDFITPVRQMSPPGVVARVLLLDGSDKLVALAFVACYGLLAWLLLRRQLQAVYEGEIYSEGFTVKRELRVRPGWRLPGVDEVISTIVEKELRYIRQNVRMIVQFVYPMILFLFLSFSGTSKRFFFTRSSTGLLAMLAGFLLLSLPNLAYNIFGMDGESFGRWLLCPLPLRKVFLGKNLTHGGILAGIYLIAAAIVIPVSSVSLLPAASVTIGFFAILVIQLGAGNLFSVYWPKRIELTRMSSRMASSAAGLASLLVVLPVGAISGAVGLAAWYCHLPWLPLAAGLIGLAVALTLYSYLLNRTVNYSHDHLEEIASTLGA